MSSVIIKQVLYKYSESVSINGERHEAFRNFAKKSEPSGPAVHDLSMNSPSLSEKRKVATVEMITAAKEVVG